MKTFYKAFGYIIVVFLLPTVFSSLIPLQSRAQNPETRFAVACDTSIPLREMKPFKNRFWEKWKKEEEHEYEVPNKFRKTSGIETTDAALQKYYFNDGKATSVIPIVNSNGLNNGNNSGGRVTPPDPAGDVGPNHYVQAVNSMLQMFTKTGTSVYGPVTTSTIWSGFSGNWDGHNDGDAIILYDETANRWIISQFAIDCPGSPYTEYQLVAVSTTSDPTGSYYRYAFQFDYMPDYPKLGVWGDGYYMAVNRFNTNTINTPFIGAGACVMERSKMLTGDPTARMVYFKTETLGGSGSAAGDNCYSMLPSDCDGTLPPAGTPNYFVYDDQPSSELRIWALHADWTNTANSTFTYVTKLGVAAYTELGTSQAVSQQGTTQKLDGLGDRLMFRNQYRNFGTYETFVTCRNVSVSGVAGIRWYEYRKNGSTFSIYQQATYSPDSKSRWMGSIAMNASGDIGLAYSVSSSTMYPSISFTGRKAADPLNQLTIPESNIQTGTASMTGASRWGDYTAMSIDPTDNQTFWTTQEYVDTYGGSWPWATKIASFTFASTPVVATLDATSVTANTATLNGTVNPNGFATNYYFEWGTTIAYGSVTTSTAAGSGTTAIAVSAPLSALTPGTTYHFRIVGTNSEGTSTGNDFTFTPGGAVLTTTAVSGLTLNGATSGGNITSDGGAAITARGVCWAANANPVASGNHTTDGTGTGTFISSIAGLSANTTYHVRAYATNANGTFYGNDITFTTLCGVYTLPFTEPFLNTTLPSCWTIVDNQGNGQVWQFGTITGYSIVPSLTGNYAYLNSDGYGMSNSQNSDLISPTLDLSSYATVNLQFKHHFRFYNPSSATLSYSIDNGSTWSTLQTYTSTTANPATFNQDIAAVAGKSNVKFKWSYTGTWAYWWAIDDIRVLGTAPKWTGVINSDWTEAGNWQNNIKPAPNANAIIPAVGVSNFPVIATAGAQCADLTIENGARISINPGGTLTVTGTLLNNNGVNGILLKSNASGTGSLLHNTADVQATIERYISGSTDLSIFKYHFVSVPLVTSNASTSSLFNGSYLFNFDEGSNSWNALGAATNTVLDETRGYMVYYPANNVTYPFAGRMNYGAFTPTLSGINSPGNNRGWNLIPNPYPSAIDWDLVSSRSNIDNAIYIWPSSAGANATQLNYYSYAAGISAPPGAMNGEIQVGQSFFVHANAALPALSFANSNRLHSNVPFLKNDSVVPNVLNVEATTNESRDAIAIRFGWPATPNFDSELDAWKLTGGADAPQLSSTLNDGSRLSINSLPLSANEIRVPLRFELNKNSQVTFNCSGMESFVNAIPIYLEDALLLKTINLRQQPNYNFVHSITDSPERFSIRFAGPTSIEPGLAKTEGKIFASDNKIYFDIPSMNNSEVLIEIFNVLGQQLFESHKTVSGIETLVTSLPAGVYIVRIKSKMLEFTSKIMIE